MKIFDSMKGHNSMMKLAVLLVLAPIAIYVLSVSATVKLYEEYREAKESIDTVSVANGRCAVYASAPLLNSGELMRMTADVRAENNVSVGHFSPEEVGREGTLRLVSAQVNLTGNFVGLLKVLAHIESVPDMKISSAEFKTVKLGKNGSAVQLDLTVLQMEDYKL